MSNFPTTIEKQNKLAVSHQLGDLLATKLDIPLLNYQIVQRGRLTSRLQGEIENGVTLVIAPAGYGKTTLLVEWLSEALPSFWRAAWVTLDLFDNTPLRFWSYVAAAIKRVYPRLRFNPLDLFQNGGELDLIGLNPLFNEIAQMPEPLCLILDDYHSVTDVKIHQSLDYLISHQPNNLHLIIASRVVPPIPLSRLRTKHQLLEVTSADLSFTMDEAEAFIKDVMALDMQHDQVARLVEATEGWIAGLQLAALSSQSQGGFRYDRENQSAGFAKAFDYLAEEVLNQQSSEIKEFLLKTSILNELSAPLCNDLLGRTDSSELLDRIVRANLFIQPIDNRLNWYRYHSLFADVLRVQLERTSPGITRELHRKACIWLSENGYPDKAVIHAVAANDLERAAEIADACAFQAIVEADLTSLVDWVAYFSDDLIAKHPNLGIHYVLASFELGRFEQIEPKLQIVEQALQKAKQENRFVPDEPYLKWEVSALRAVMNCLCQDYERCICEIIDLQRDTPKADKYFYGFMNFNLAEAYELFIDLQAAAGALEEGRNFAWRNKHVLQSVHTSCGLARIRKYQGRLKDAAEEYRHALDLTVSQTLDESACLFAQCGLMGIALERNELPADLAPLKEWLQKIDPIDISTLPWHYGVILNLRLAKFHLYVGDRERGNLFLQQARKKILHSFEWIYTSEVTDVLVGYWLADGRAAEADVLLTEELASFTLTRIAKATRQAALGRIYLAQHKFSQAEQALLEMLVEIGDTDSNERRLEGLILLAQAQQAKGDLDLAIETIARAVQLAAPEGYIRIFTLEGEPVRDLLEAYLSIYLDGGAGKDKAGQADYLRKLIAAFDPFSVKVSPSSTKCRIKTSFVAPVAEPLSEREIEVLGLLAAGKPTKEIAAVLMISVNTTKAHLKSIYRKMGGHSRRMVIERARELSLL